MRIGIDIDDTLTDINEELENAALEYATKLGKSQTKDISNLVDKNDGNIYQAKYGFTYDELKYFLKDIQESITGKAVPRENAKETISKLRKAGNEVYIVTARDFEFHDDPYTLSKEWLDKNDIEYDKLIVNARDKAQICKEEKIDVFIDDKTSNCIDVSKIGVIAIRIANNNIQNNEFITLKDWNSIYKYISKIEFMDVLDENGNITGNIKTRDKIAKDKDFYKIVNLWLMNPKTKQILLQKRSNNKESHPNKWDLTSGGHVKVGESSLEAIIRETKEEIGIDVSKDDLIKILEVKEKQKFVDIYFIEKDVKIEDLTLQVEEVSDAKYFSLKELITAHDTNDIHFIKHSFFPELVTYMKEKLKEIK